MLVFLCLYLGSCIHELLKNMPLEWSITKLICNLMLTFNKIPTYKQRKNKGKNIALSMTEKFAKLSSYRKFTSFLSENRMEIKGTDSKLE